MHQGKIIEEGAADEIYFSQACIHAESYRTIPGKNCKAMDSLFLHIDRFVKHNLCHPLQEILATFMKETNTFFNAPQLGFKGTFVF